MKMMTMEMMKKQLMTLCEDISFWENTDKNMLGVIVEDFEGFDEDWNEVFTDINEDAVNTMIEWLDEHCDSHDGGCLYQYYTFGDLVVCLDWESYDI